MPTVEPPQISPVFVQPIPESIEMKKLVNSMKITSSQRDRGLSVGSEESVMGPEEERGGSE